MEEVVILVVTVAAWIAWTIAGKDNPAWMSKGMGWGGYFIIVLVGVLATISVRGS